MLTLQHGLIPLLSEQQHCASYVSENCAGSSRCCAKSGRVPTSVQNMAYQCMIESPLLYDYGYHLSSLHVILIVPYCLRMQVWNPAAAANNWTGQNMAESVPFVYDAVSTGTI